MPALAGEGGEEADGEGGQLNADIGGDPEGYYLIVSDSGEASGQGLDFINGMTFLERFYAVYDVAGGRVGFATTKQTYCECN